VAHSSDHAAATLAAAAAATSATAIDVAAVLVLDWPLT